MMDLAPMIGMVETTTLLEELEGVVEWSACWDATYRFAEVWGALVYFFNRSTGRSTGRRQKRLINLRLLQQSLTGPETCGLVINAAATMRLPLAHNVFDIFDRCAVNYSAFNMLHGLAPDSLPIGCISHTSSHVGEKAELPMVKSLVEGLNVATHSVTARQLFRTEYGETIEGHSDIRWYCTFNQAKQQQRLYPHLGPWVNSLEVAGVVPQTCGKLRAALLHPGTLKLELSVMVDAFDPFVIACYTLEGDAAALVFRVHSDWLHLITHASLCRATTALTRTRATAQEIVTQQFPALLQAQIDLKVNQLIAEQLQKVEPAFAYFDTKTAELKDQLDFYEAATMFHPLLVQRAGGLSQPDLLRLVAFIPRLNKPAMIATLTAQREEYVTECLATPLSPTPWQQCDIEALWHSTRFRRLAAWHGAALTVMLAQPSSAPIERVFSMLKSVVDDQQGQALQDFQAGAMMTYYNARERAR